MSYLKPGEKRQNESVKLTVSKGGGVTKVEEKGKSSYNLPTSEANRRFNRK
ncbi:MAG: hypothetical protein AAGC64_04580 [Bacteroidota bacterium]